MIKVAVIGVNNIGQLHSKFYHQCEDTHLVAVCDLVKERVETIAQQYGVFAYTDIHTMLREQDIDMVCVATGGFEKGRHHYDPVMAAIEAGKDVMVEKPLTNSSKEAREMVDKARQKSVRLACNLNHHFTHAAYKGKEMMDTGKLGSLLYINMKLTIRNPDESSPWVHLRALHPHSIDVMRYFAGDIQRVQAFMIKAPGRNVWSTASINLKFLSGAVGHLMGSYDMSMKHPIEHTE